MRALSLLCVALVATTVPLQAGWRAARFVGVPLPPPNQPAPVELSGGIELNIFDVEGDVSPGDLEVLKRYPPFSGLSDAQIRDKMNIMRRNVDRAIQLIAYENGDLSYCLGRLWHQRRICIAFTSEAFGGITNANGLPNASDRCERAAIAININRIPCDSRKAYDGDLIVLANTMAHEALHVTQEWSGVIPPRRPRDNADIDLRLQIQDNEIAASEGEMRRLDNLFEAFRRAWNTGQIPDPDPTTRFDVLPMTRRALEMFFADVPAADREARFRALLSALNSAYLKANMTRDCRVAVKRALEELKETGDDRAFVRRLRGNRDAAGWFSVLGNRLFTGVFQTDIFAGGLGDDTNVVRQWVDGTEHRWTLPVDFITDAYRIDDKSLLVSGSDENAAQGTLFLLGDTDGDRIFDNVMPTLTHPYLAGGVTFTPVPGGLYCFSPPTQMVFEFQLGSDGFFTYPTGISFAGSIGDPGESLVTRVVLSEDMLEGWGIAENDFANFPGTRWTHLSRATMDVPFTSNGDFNPLDDFGIPPAIVRWPWIGDQSVRVAGSAGAGVTVEVVDLAGSAMASGTGTLGADGFGEIGLPVALTGQYGVRVVENGYSSRALRTAGDIAPSFEATKRDAWFDLKTHWYPETVHKYYFRATLDAPAEPIACVQADGFGRTSLSVASWFPATAADSSTGLFHVELGRPSDYALIDDSRTVPPGVESKIRVNANDTYPHGTTFHLDGWNGTALHRDLIDFDSKGLVKIRPLSSPTQLSFTYAAKRDGITQATATVTIEVKASLLAQPRESFEWIPGRGLTNGYSVWSLQIGKNDRDEKLFYPVYQYRLTNNPADKCKEPHWHASLVFAVSDPDRGGENDPMPGDCGFGRRSEVKPILHFVPADVWNQFLQDHPPPP